jgi:hypothetical protein
MGSIVINSSWAMFLDLEMVKKTSPLSSQSHHGMGRTPLVSVKKKNLFVLPSAYFQEDKYLVLNNSLLHKCEIWSGVSIHYANKQLLSHTTRDEWWVDRKYFPLGFQLP